MTTIPTMSAPLQAYLQSWYTTSTNRKINDGITVELTYPEFLGLFSKRQLRSLEKAIQTNRLRYQQDRENECAFVLTWKSYAARSTDVFSTETATVCSRQKSRTINLAQPGDSLRPSHVANISRGLAGKPKSDEHREKIGDAQRGKPKTQSHRSKLSKSLTGQKNSDATKAAKSEAAKLRWAAYRAAKAAGQ